MQRNKVFFRMLTWILETPLFMNKVFDFFDFVCYQYLGIIGTKMALRSKGGVLNSKQIDTSQEFIPDCNKDTTGMKPNVG